MAKVTFSSKWGRVNARKKADPAKPESKPAEDLVRDIKKNQKQAAGEDYREKSLALHGLHCARCGRDFEASQRHLLTVHHKDGNHHNNPPDGSNWENLCVYCHEDVHSRGVLGDYLRGEASSKEVSLVYEDASGTGGFGPMADKLRQALQKNKK
ncbi:MAG TPA: HNH nuclease family protein [Deltaproteobacteria bacterium]|nr:HNH nuclease family protein [Deltaproteobacteria bacterium]